MSDSQQPPEEEAEFEVEDEEGFVDRQRKKNILQNRQKCEETAEYIFPRMNRGQIRYDTAVRSFHEPVRNYLLSIEPLLKDSSLPYADEAYLQQPMGIVEFPLPPKFQGLGGRPDPQDIKRRGFKLLGEPPEPDERTIIGLKEIIEKDEYTHSWSVDVEPVRGIAAKHKQRDTVTERVVKPTPKMALVNAVRTADEFLQETNVGLSVGTDDSLDSDKIAPDY